METTRKTGEKSFNKPTPFSHCMDKYEEERPWGFFRVLARNEKCTVKILHVSHGQKLSRQYHKKRDEFWKMLDEGLVVELGEREFKLKKHDEIFIPKGTPHRISSEKGGDVLEIAFGEFDENDIVRLENNYGRAALPQTNLYTAKHKGI